MPDFGREVLRSSKNYSPTTLASSVDSLPPISQHVSGGYAAGNGRADSPSEEVLGETGGDSSSNGVVVKLQMSFQNKEAKGGSVVGVDEVGVFLVKKNRKGIKKGGRGECKSLEDHVNDWVQRRVGSGVPERDFHLPFLCNAPKMVSFIYFSFLSLLFFVAVSV